MGHVDPVVDEHPEELVGVLPFPQFHGQAITRFSGDLKTGLEVIWQVTPVSDLENVLLELLADISDLAFQHISAQIDEHNMIADLFDLFHPVRGKNNTHTFLVKAADL